MKESRFKPCLVLFALMLIALQGCHLPISLDEELSVDERAQTSVALTLAVEEEVEEPEVSLEVSEASIEVPEPTITDTLIPDITITPTITLTPTLGTPMVSVSMNTNCRSGPGKIYGYIGALLVGESAEVVGQSTDGQYWIIKNPDHPGECWLWGRYATVTGPTDDLPEYTPPPTPTPTHTPTPAFYWGGDWSARIAPEDAVFSLVYSMTVTVDGRNFTAVVDLGAEGIMNVLGTISDDYLSVSGTWSGGASTGTFELYALGTDQFQGNHANPLDPDDVLAWCGGREGAGIPSPCMKP